MAAMTDHDGHQQHPAPPPPRPPDPPTLADGEDDEATRGRIGSGPHERLSSYLLAGLLLLAIAAIGIAAALDDDAPGGEAAARQPAPDFEMTTFDGSTFRLADHRGKVVVMNIWASWCEPCRDEMPALQAASERYGDDVVFVGVGAKADRDDAARAFAAEFGITYPIGRDTEGGTAGTGRIAQAYGVIGYPTTFFIDPEGNIAVTIINELDPAMIDAYIAQARQT